MNYCHEVTATRRDLRGLLQSPPSRARRETSCEPRREGVGVEAHSLKEARKCRTIEPVTPRLGGGSSCVVSLRMARRSLRPRPGRTSRARPSGRGSIAGAGPALRSGRRWSVWPTGRAVRTSPRRRSRPRRPPGSASCASGQGGVPAGSPMRSTSPERTPRSTRCFAAAGCRAARAAERPAVVRYEWPCPGQLLHMDVKTLREVLRARPQGHGRPHPALPAHRLGVLPLDRR